MKEGKAEREKEGEEGRAYWGALVYIIISKRKLFKKRPLGRYFDQDPLAARRLGV
jgi:hypothetical protein